MGFDMYAYIYCACFILMCNHKSCLNVFKHNKSQNKDIINKYILYTTDEG